MTENNQISEALETEYLLEKIEGENPVGWRNVCEGANNGCPYAKDKGTFYGGCVEGLCNITIIPTDLELSVVH